MILTKKEQIGAKFMRLSGFRKSMLLTMMALLPILEPLSSERLSILVTNDDGISSQGLKVLSRALKAAGYEVTVVAPATQQSGSGMKVTLGNLELKKIDGETDTWSVNGSPADAVSVGVKHVMKERSIDLVVSGPNFGQNLGSNIFLSGTVGGAMTAVMNGIPAIALSVGISLVESDAAPNRFPSTLLSFEPASAFLISLLKQWDKETIREVIKQNTLISINYPEIGKENIKGYKWVDVGKQGGFTINYSLGEEGILAASISENETSKSTARDLGLFNQGYITLSLLSLDWNVPRTKYHFHVGDLR